MTATAEALELTQAPPAKYATPRDPARATIGPRIGRTSRLLGATLMPWQQQVADVAGEAHGRIPGAFRYRLVIVTVPRQAGKTTLLRAVRVDRCLTTPKLGSWMSAQTGKDARKRWEDLVEAVRGPREDAPLARFTSLHKSAGSERLRFTNGSFVAPFSPVPKSLHGETPPLVDLDEAWSYDAAQGYALLNAIRPAQLTLANRQLWVVSTKGTSESVFLNELLKMGKDSLGNPNSEIAFFEWSADEELAEADPTGDDTLSFHPALGHTQQLADLRGELPADPTPAQLASYRRGILNLPTVSTTTVVDLARFDALALEGQLPAVPWDRAVVGYAVANGRTGSSCWAAWEDAGTVVLRFLETGPGAAWLPSSLTAYRAKGARVLAADDAGATRTITTSASMAGQDVTALGARDYATACDEFLGRIEQGTLRHDDAPELRQALEAAELGRMAGGRGFDEDKSRGPLDALRAAVVAAYLSTRALGPQLF